MLAGITGSSFFPGGMGIYSNYTLTFEQGPSQPVTLQWATYYDAADEAGISRIWGGIHPPIDNLTGRRMASQVGKDVWALSKQYFDGSIARAPITLQVTQTTPASQQIQLNTMRGFYYKLQSTGDLNQPFSDEPGGPTLAYDTVLTVTNSSPGTVRFYRAACLLGP